jgi:hypothetical protein
MLTKIKIALATALIIGTASAALANDSGENNMGGFVMPGSLDGVNGFEKSRDGTWHVRSDWHRGAR